jgi:hypothetical protein
MESDPAAEAEETDDSSPVTDPLSDDGTDQTVETPES